MPAASGHESGSHWSMNTVEGAAVGLLALSAGGALPAVCIARSRLVVVPLVPLAGAVLASLAVTAMTAAGGTFFAWYVTLSLLAAATVAAVWLCFPRSRPWGGGSGRGASRELCAAAGIAGLVVCVVYLSALKAPMTQFDTRDVWLLHPFWYLQGHARTVATLQSRAYTFGHPPYPPLIGGSVALTWLAAGVKSYRLGVVMIALLSALSVMAAGTAVFEVASGLASSTEDASRRRRTLVVAVALMAGVMFVAFSAAGALAASGYADLLWASAAVGAVSYGLVLQSSSANVGAAAVLATVAGVTKLEGSLTAAVIVGLIAARWYLALRPGAERRALARAGAIAVGCWAVIGVWPLVIQLLGAVPDVPFQGPRQGTDASRFGDVVSGVANWAGSNLGALCGAIVVALVGAFFLRGTRRRAGLGNDIWAWAVIFVALSLIFGAYVIGPGVASRWVQVSVARTTLFPALDAWWIMTTWAVIAAYNIRWAENDKPAPELMDARMSRHSNETEGPIGDVLVPNDDDR